MTTFTTTVTQMYTLNTPEPDFVVNVLWNVQGVDGEYVANIDGNSIFSVPGTSFTPYNELTEATVIGWIPTEAIASAQANVQGQIDSQLNPPVSPQNTPLPWAA